MLFSDVKALNMFSNAKLIGIRLPLLLAEIARIIIIQQNLSVSSTMQMQTPVWTAFRTHFHCSSHIRVQTLTAVRLQKFSIQINSNNYRRCIDQTTWADPLDTTESVSFI